MKLLYSLIILLILNSCSFDNKTGIWENNNEILVKEDNNEKKLKDFKTLSISSELFDREIPLNNKFKFKLSPAINNLEWNDVFFQYNNSSKNFKFNDLNKLNLKSKKVSRHKINNNVLYKDNFIIASDVKGSLILFSIQENKVIQKFNFYKKKYKDIEKNLNIVIEKNLIFISDNIGYLYAYDFKKNNILWANNFKIPFGSNLKIAGNKLLLSNQNNSIFFIDKLTGEVLKMIPTEEVSLKNQFTNSLSLNKEKNLLFFLNTYGSLYSIEINSMSINWFINLNQSTNINPSSLFFSNQIVNDRKRIVISSNESLYLIDAESGSILKKYNFAVKIKPLIIDEYFFLITKNNLLICVDLKNGEIIYSYRINDDLSKFLNIEKKKVEYRNMFILNGNIFIFIKDSYFIKYDIKGRFKDFKKLPSKIQSLPIVIDNFILYLNNKNKIFVYG